MKQCLIISGGEYSRLDINREKYFVIACDKGYEYARRDGIIPDLILGDFDSYEEELPDGIEIIKLPKEKDDTDTMYAVKEAIKREYRHLEIRCALGKRPDHEYANYQCMAYSLRHGASCEIISDNCQVYGVKDGEIEIKCEKGQTFSVFSYTNESMGVSISGAHYNVENVGLSSSYPLGQSNYAEADRVKITVENGMLLIMKISGEE